MCVSHSCRCVLICRNITGWLCLCAGVVCVCVCVCVCVVCVVVVVCGGVYQVRQQMEEQVAQKSTELEQYLQRVHELEDMYQRLQEALDDERQARQDEETVRKLQSRGGTLSSTHILLSYSH